LADGDRDTRNASAVSTQPEQEARFARVVGTRFLGFVCNVTERQLQARLETGRRLTGAKEAVLQQALTAAVQSAVLGFQVGGGEADFLYPLLEYDETGRMARPNLLRVAAGGDIPRRRPKDPAAAALATLARDLYPALLLEPTRRIGRGPVPRWVERTWSISPVSFRHPASAEFERAVDADPSLNVLFTKDTPESGKTGFIWTSLGTGRSIQLSMLAHDLLIATLFELTLGGAFDQAAFIDGALEQLDVLRRLVAGERVDVRCSVAFVGAELPGRPLATPWGTLRAPTTGELELRADTPVAHSQEIVLSTTVPLEMRIDADSMPQIMASPFTETAAATFQAVQHRADMLALTLLLTFDREPAVAVARTWTLVENPLNQGPSLSWFQSAVPLHPHVLVSEDRPKIRAWATRIERDYSDRLDIAVKRTLSSLTTRWDPTDRLIDAVVALENLFGTGSGELAFRISAGAAYLLEQDARRRADVQSEVSRLYNVRSKIVHGAHSPAPATVEPLAKAATTFAVRSLRVLFAQQRRLLDEKDRARLLILGTN
jgi:hypothetical protein